MRKGSVQFNKGLTNLHSNEDRLAVLLSVVSQWVQTIGRRRWDSSIKSGQIIDSTSLGKSNLEDKLIGCAVLLREE